MSEEPQREDKPRPKMDVVWLFLSGIVAIVIYFAIDVALTKVRTSDDVRQFLLGHIAMVAVYWGLVRKSLGTTILKVGFAGFVVIHFAFHAFLLQETSLKVPADIVLGIPESVVVTFMFVLFGKKPETSRP